MRRFFTLIFFFLILSLGFILPSYSGEWRDTFDGEKLKGWTLISKDEAKNWESTWQPKDGKLNVTINLPDFLPQVADFLQWTAHKINTDSLIVVSHDNSGLCIFLGKRMLDQPHFASGYKFCIGRASQILFDKDGNRIEGRIRADYNIRLTRPQLKVIFHEGRFIVFGLDVLLTDFKAPELQRIDVVGLLAEAGGADKRFQGSISAISISGPGIPDHNQDVKPQGKLAVTWGKLKGF